MNPRNELHADHADGRQLPPRAGSPNRLLISAGVATGLLLAAVMRLESPPSAPPYAENGPAAGQSDASNEPTIDQQTLRRQRWDARVEPRIAEAHRACQTAIDQAVRDVTRFVGQRRQGARPFAESMLTIRSKWNLGTSKLPTWLGGDPSAHRQFLEREFNTYLFAPEQLRHAIHAAVVSYQNDVESIENQLLVDVRADLEDLSSDAMPEVANEVALVERFDRLAGQLTPKVAQALGVDMLRVSGSWVSGEVAARVAVRVMSAAATRLGVSAGIMGAGAGASWATFGLSVVAAIAVDQVVGAAIDWATDPVGQLEGRVLEMLNEITLLIIQGHDDTPGLRDELIRMEAVRARVRHAAMQQIVLNER